MRLHHGGANKEAASGLLKRLSPASSSVQCHSKAGLRVIMFMPCKFLPITEQSGLSKQPGLPVKRTRRLFRGRVKMFCDSAHAAYKYGGRTAHAIGSGGFSCEVLGFFLCRIKNESVQSAEWAAHFTACKEGENGLLIILGACLYHS